MASEIFGEEGNKDQNFVRWYNQLRAEYQEDLVKTFIESGGEATIWTINGLVKGTSIYIKTNSYSGNGIVRHSEREEKGYRVVIQLDCEDMLSPYSSQFDPGVLALDGFLTEEEESKILESVGEELEVDSDLDEAPSDAFNLAGALNALLTPATRLGCVGGIVADTEDSTLRLQ